jgi:small-conductance mechanosensitive channel
MLLIATIAFGGATSCKSKKKLAKEAAAAEYAAKVEQAKKDLNAIINEETDWTLDQQAERVATIKSYNIDDQEVKDLIVQAEQKIAELRARKAEEERLRKQEEARKKMAHSEFEVLDNSLGSIAGATSYDDANRKIDAAMQQFASPDIPVLIIISQENGVNDYDRPTTISKFLNYLKDKKQYKYKVESVKRDALGKITELELIVKY